MKKIVLLLVLLLSLISATSAIAGSCVIPKFIKKGATLEIAAGMGSKTFTIVEIDKKSCWMKTEDGYWFNINAIQVIIPKNK